MEDFENRFDLEVRSLMENAEEDVPSRIWDGVSSALDRKKAPVPAAVWWKRAAFAVAAAAAAAAAVFLVPRSTPDNTPTPGNPMVRTEVPVTAAPALLSEAVSTRPKIVAAAPAPAPVVVAAETAPQEMPSPETTETTGTKKDTKDQGQTAKVPLSFNKALFNKESRPKDIGRISISAGGNLQSNGSPAKMLTGFRYARAKAPAKAGITEVSESTYGMTLSAGIGVRYNFNPKWSIGTGITYSLLSRSFTATYYDTSSPDLSVTGKTDNFQHYIGIPLNVYYNVISRNAIKFYVWGGGSVEKGVANKFILHDSSRDIRLTERIPGVQWSAGGGLGVEFAVAPNFGIYLDPGWRYYFNCAQPNSIRTQQPFTMNFEIGIRAGF